MLFIAYLNMDYLNKILNSQRRILFILFVLAAVNLFVFWLLFGFHPNNDTESFLDTINFFRGNDAYLQPNRYLTPLYPVISAKFLFFISPVRSLIFMNIVFYFGLVLATYGLIARVFKNRFIGFVTAFLVMTNYAMVRYALTQVQDMGGYFWLVLTIYFGWRWWEDKRDSWLYLSGIAVAFGILTKESGALGALFVGMLILCKRDTIKNTAIAIFKVAFFPLLVMIINFSRGQEIHLSSFDLYRLTWQSYGPENYTLLRWVGVNATTYNLAWGAIIGGLVIFFKNFRTISQDIKVYLLVSIPTALTQLAWPVFISRTVFIAAWLLLPIASYALWVLYDNGKIKRSLSIFLIILFIVAPYILQNTLRYAHLFVILEQCRNNIICGWNYFWQNRDSFSKIK